MMKRSSRKTNAPSDGTNRGGSSELPVVGAINHKGGTTTSAPEKGNNNGNGRMKRLISNMSNATSGSLRYSADSDSSSVEETEKTRLVKRLLEQCEAVGWPFRKKLILANLNLNFDDIPTEGMCSEKLGTSLNTLSLRGNPIEMLPDSLVLRLGGLRTLELGNCGLTELPECWDLPFLKRLSLGRNKLTAFPHEDMFWGIPNLEQLDMHQNYLVQLKLPDNLMAISNLQHLCLDYNHIETIPAHDLFQLHSLKTLRFVNNRIQTVPSLICEMDLKVLDVSSNPLIQPPLETCARGICSMRRYYKCLQAEEKGVKPKSLIRATARKIKKFPASLSSTFRSISDPSSRKKVASDVAIRESEEEEPEILVGFDQADTKSGEVAINDSLKVIFVGMALSGKTSIIKRLTEGREARIPNQDDRTIGVDIYTWKPGVEKCGYEDPDMKTTIEMNEDIMTRLKAPIDVKFSMWDFAGQDVYHATHELFFSCQALYVLVWDMANHIPSILRGSLDEDQGEYNLNFNESDEEDGDAFFFEDVERRRAIRSLEKDVDDKLNFWVHTIQASAPGAAILPVASFDDYFSEAEAAMRCRFMKDRLLKKEALRVEGMKQRLARFESSEEGDGQEAELLQRLICPFNRPKLLFGVDEDQDVVRVSCEDFTGFDRLAKAIVNVATGRRRGGWPYPVFRGHIGARIPRMRLEVRDLVRKLRQTFKVVETGYFLAELGKMGIHNYEDVSDALHFLTSIGECSYFGEVIGSSGEQSLQQERSGSSNSDALYTQSSLNTNGMERLAEYSRHDDSSNKSVASTPRRHRSGSSSNESGKPSGFDEYIFVNPRWLVAAVACILRHDLTREIHEVRRMIRQTIAGGNHLVSSLKDEFSDMLDTDVNVPVVSTTDMFLLWETKRFTKKAADRAKKYSNNTKVSPYDFLQKVMIRFSICVPVNLNIDRACLGGRDFTSQTLSTDHEDKSSQFFFLPGLLGKEEPKDAWTFKTMDSWKTTLCHTILFPDGAPPGLMERLTGSILNDFMTIGSAASDDITDSKIRLKEILCWRTAFFLRVAVDVVDAGVVLESLVDIFVILVDHESNYCVASDSMGVGMRRLIISARGQAGDHGSKIWKGGYMRVIVMVKRYLMSEYQGLEYDFQIVCPVCLATRGIASVGFWNLSTLLSLAETDSTMRCRYGHNTDIRLLTALQGPFKDTVIREHATSPSYLQDKRESDALSLAEVLKSCVLVCYWDEKTHGIVRAGSGFIVDKKRGFIVTAGHCMLDADSWKEPRGGKIVIGVIPEGAENVCVFRYFARIVSKDESISKRGYCTVDACVLQITTRMENDVFDSGKDIGEQPEKLLNSPDLMKVEDLPSLQLTDKVELDETIRILGFNQGGEGLIEPNEVVSINRSADFARGYVVMRFVNTNEIAESDRVVSQKFQPKSEIVTICPTIGGHSGGPCINQQGEVIGILSRADPADKQRCYLVPTSEFKPLIKIAKRALASGI